MFIRAILSHILKFNCIGVAAESADVQIHDIRPA